MIEFKLPENLTTFDYKKLIRETEIKSTDHFDKPISFLSLLNTMPDCTKKNIAVMTAGNLSAVQGKAKSRKTFFLVLCSHMILTQKDLRIVIMDTEQFQYHSSLMLHRINKLTPLNKLRLFNLRKYSIDVRLEFVENYILNEKPDVLFLDNVRDCMIDINSWVETNKILTTFIQLADEYKTHICLTLHENPGRDNDKARGAIGTELQNKCETIFKLDIDQDNPEYTRVKGLFTRNMKFDEIEFRINEEGLPVLVSDFEAQKENIDLNVKPF